MALGLWGLGPRQKLVDTALEMPVYLLGEDVFEAGLGLDVEELTLGDQRGQHRPAFGAAFAAGEEPVFPRQAAGGCPQRRFTWWITMRSA